MWGKSIKHSLSAALLCGTVGATQAASIWIEPTDLGASIIQGNSFQMDIYMDFTDEPTIGGGFDILFDPALVSYVSESFILSPQLGSDPLLSRDDSPQSPPLQQVLVDDNNGKIIGAAFGDLIGLTGPSLVGSLTFIADQVGFAQFGLEATEDPLVGEFYSSFTLEPQVVSYSGREVEISPIPLPAAVWMMLSGLTGLGLLARRRT